jgi:[glutamine synthetase] adenylyltransferase / [glutamine synthetase]-adenylyl-L-tyrosine phosphorylase
VVAVELRSRVEASAAPPAVAVALERLSEAHPALPEQVAEDQSLADALIAVTAASRSLTTLLIADEAAIDVLRALEERRPMGADDADALARWKRLEFLRIAARDLVGLDPLEDVGAALTEMAADVFRQAGALAGVADLTVVAMGKCGGRELNYASDVDIVFVGGSEADASAVLDLARPCFRVDTDLRPEGRNGPLTRSLASYEAYWDRWARPWEFQALLKARPIAGEPALADAFTAAVARHVWERRFTADDLRSLRAMKARSEDLVIRQGLERREVKRAPGGLRDIEFAVQLLQLVHGRHDHALRSPNTLDALAELGAAGYVDPVDARTLRDAYRFLRTVEHRLQLVDEQQVYAVPKDREARTRLARVLGYRDAASGDAATQLDETLRRYQSTVRSIHERLYFRPLLEAFLGVEGRLGQQAIEERLTAFGFIDVTRTREAVRELTRGLTRTSRLMHQTLPLLLGWLSDSPDPDLGLLGLRTLADGPQRTMGLATSFRDSPEVARRLCTLLGTSRLLAVTLRQNPDLIPLLADDRELVPPSREAIGELAAESVAWRADANERIAGLHRFVQREQLRIAASDVLTHADVSTVGAGLTNLAEAVLEEALADIDAGGLPFAVVAMGRFGGAELSYASDLDVLFVYDGASAADAEVAEHTSETLRRVVRGSTPAQRLYELDADLRPEGKQGPLARSLDAYANYYDRWAAPWELQALTRARPVAGDRDVADRFIALAGEHIWSSPPGPEAVREIRRMKARIERERIPVGEDPQFHLKLGRGSLSDVEWTVQLLQLRHQVREPGTMAALDALEVTGAIDAADAAVLAEAYRFCEHARNRWFLVKGGPGDALPAEPEQLARLARSLGTDGSNLREEYRRVTRRARAVFERLFYGDETGPPGPQE